MNKLFCILAGLTLVFCQCSNDKSSDRTLPRAAKVVWGCDEQTMFIGTVKILNVDTLLSIGDTIYMNRKRLVIIK